MEVTFSSKDAFAIVAVLLLKSEVWMTCLKFIAYAKYVLVYSNTGILDN